MTVTSGNDIQDPDPALVKCAEILDKLIALSAGGTSGELPLVAASQLASDLANDLAVYDARIRARGAGG